LRPPDRAAGRRGKPRAYRRHDACRICRLPREVTPSHKVAANLPGPHRWPEGVGALCARPVPCEVFVGTSPVGDGRFLGPPRMVEPSIPRQETGVIPTILATQLGEPAGSVAGFVSLASPSLRAIGRDSPLLGTKLTRTPDTNPLRPAYSASQWKDLSNTVMEEGGSVCWRKAPTSTGQRWGPGLIP